VLVLGACLAIQFVAAGVNTAIFGLIGSRAGRKPVLGVTWPACTAHHLTSWDPGARRCCLGLPFVFFSRTCIL